MLGTRPEHLHSVGEAAPDTLHCAVEGAEELGADTLLHGRIDGADLEIGRASCRARVQTCPLPISRLGPGVIELPGGTRLAAPNSELPASEIMLGIRPEHLHPVGEAAPDTLHCEVEVAEELGADTLMHGRIDGADL